MHHKNYKTMLIITIIAILLSTFNRCIQFEVHVRDTSWMFVYLCDHRLPYCTGLNAVNFFALIYIVKHLGTSIFCNFEADYCNSNDFGVFFVRN